MLTVAGRTYGRTKDCYVIAEIGHNHEGRVDRAVELFEAAARAGAHAVKLQKRDNVHLFTRTMLTEEYSGRNSFGATYGEHRQALEFGPGDYRYLQQVASDLGVDFFATPFDHASADLLLDLDVPVIKIASGDLTNTPLIDYVAKSGKPIILSTGGGDMVDVQRAVDVITRHTDNFAVLQCTAVYPASEDFMNISVVGTYRASFPSATVGLSAHDQQNYSCMLTFALGARVFEKHYTLDRLLPGTDHKFSLEPDHFSELVRGLVRSGTLLGDSEKVALTHEAPALVKMGKKLVAARRLTAGQTVGASDIAIKSPGDGMKPYLFEEVVGQVLNHNLNEDDGFHPSGFA